MKTLPTKPPPPRRVKPKDTMRFYSVVNEVPLSEVRPGEVYLLDKKFHIRGEDGEPEVSPETKVLMQNRGWVEHCRKMAGLPSITTTQSCNSVDIDMTPSRERRKGRK